MKKNKCGISYAWEGDIHSAWVKHLAESLKDYFEIVLDKEELKGGTRNKRFMRRMIKESDFVLMICTPTYCKKFNNQEGRVGLEAVLILEEIKPNIENDKFIPIMLNGNRDESLPDYFKDVDYIDFRDKSQYEEKIRELIEIVKRKDEITEHSLFEYLKNDFDEGRWLLIGKSASFDINNTDLSRIDFGEYKALLEAIGITTLQELKSLESLIIDIAPSYISHYSRLLSERKVSIGAYPINIFRLALLILFSLMTRDIQLQKKNTNVPDEVLLNLINSFYKSKTDIFHIIQQIEASIVKNNGLFIVAMTKNPWSDSRKQKLQIGNHLKCSWNESSAEIVITDNDYNDFGSFNSLYEMGADYERSAITNPFHLTLMCQVLSKIYIGLSNELKIVEVVPFDKSKRKGFILGKIFNINKLPYCYYNMVKRKSQSDNSYGQEFELSKKVLQLDRCPRCGSFGAIEGDPKFWICGRCGLSIDEDKDWLNNYFSK